MATATFRASGSVFHVTLTSPPTEPASATVSAWTAMLDRLGHGVMHSSVDLVSWAFSSDRAYLGLVGPANEIETLLSRAWLAPGDDARPTRPRAELVAGDTAAFVAEMIAFHHNAPVRAGRCSTAWDSPATSHRPYICLAPRPPYLSCARGLELCGVGDTPAGRRQFDETVLLRGQRCSPTRLVRTESGGAGGGKAPAHGETTGVARPQAGAATRRLRRPAPQPLPSRPALDATTAVFRPRRQQLPNVTVARVLGFAATALGTSIASLSGSRGAGLQRLGQRASAWCWCERFGGTPDALARALDARIDVVTGDLRELRLQRDDVARRLGDALADDLARGDRPRPSVGVPRPTGAATAAVPSGSTDYTDVDAAHPPTALSDVLTAH